MKEDTFATEMYIESFRGAEGFDRSFASLSVRPVCSRVDGDVGTKTESGGMSKSGTTV